MLWLLYLVGAICFVRGAVSWLWTAQFCHSGFRGAAYLYWIGGVLAFLPGTWWCLLPASVGATICASHLRDVKRALLVAGFMADPFSSEARRLCETLNTLHTMDVLRMRDPVKAGGERASTTANRL